MPVNNEIHVLGVVDYGSVRSLQFGVRDPKTREIRRRLELERRDGRESQILFECPDGVWSLSPQQAADLGACLLEAACYEEAHEWIDEGRYTFTEPAPEEIQPVYQILHDDAWALHQLPDNYVQCTVTSPPYFNIFRYDAGPTEIGVESDPDDYLRKLGGVATELLRVTKPGGSLFLNIGETWNGSGGPGGDHRDHNGEYNVVRGAGANIPNMQPKQRLCIPECVVMRFALAGWIPRQLIIWNTENPFRGAADRPSQSFEWVHVFTKSPHYTWRRHRVLQNGATATKPQLSTPYTGEARYPGYEAEGREDPSKLKRRTIEAINNRAGKVFPRAVLHIPTGAQPVVTMPDGSIVRGIASFPQLLPEICINWASDPGDVVLDPFSGMGTTGVAALKWKRHYVGIELHEQYHAASVERIRQAGHGDPLPDGELPPALNTYAMSNDLPLWGGAE